ncbi:MAG: GDSL-type esterase/lipase family protein [Actinomycetota bacterium]|nr:GDSL-type esterase/lipase family protein [Actinomycetota bacterium]
MSPAAEPELRKPRLGVLAFGDSITNAGGELQWGVALHSWALWTARGLGLPYTGFAVDGARVGDLVTEQLAAFAARSADPNARYDVGCLYIGVNDVQAPDWDPVGFEAGFGTALAFLSARCERTLALTLATGLGVPPATAAARAANAVIGRQASAHGALVVSLDSFGARNQVMPDRVHPTAFGQIAIAERALAVLAADGLPTRVAPASLLDYEVTWLGRLRHDLTYLYRSAKAQARAGLERVGNR